MLELLGSSKEKYARAGGSPGRSRDRKLPDFFQIVPVRPIEPHLNRPALTSLDRRRHLRPAEAGFHVVVDPDPGRLLEGAHQQRVAAEGIGVVDLVLAPGTLGGRFTTVEGLLVQIIDELGTKNPFIKGDASSNERKETFEKFISKIKKVNAISQLV